MGALFLSKGFAIVHGFMENIIIIKKKIKLKHCLEVFAKTLK